MWLSFLIVLIVFSLLYALTILSFTYGWNKTKEQKVSETKILSNSFSIIIALRNEAENLSNLLNDLSALEYPSSNFEILLVDDESTDSSYEIISNFIVTNNCNWKLLSSQGGKKHAIKEALSIATNEFILTLDTDCRVPNKLLLSYNQALHQRKAKMIAGPISFISKSTLWGQFMDIEFMSLVASGAGAMGIRKPIMLNAANLLFDRKMAIEALGEIYESDIASGDDIFLMHYVANNYGEDEIYFLKDQDAIVETPAPKSLNDWLQQRFRWTSKAKHYKINYTSLTAIIILGFNILILASLIFISLIGEFWYLPITLFILKTIIDLPILLSAARFFDKKGILKNILLLEIIYPFFIVFVGVFGLFIGVGWKGRKN